MKRRRAEVVIGLIAGIGLGIFLEALLINPRPAALAAPNKPAADLQALASKIELLEAKLPDQAHAMQDVGYHFANLWFAAQKENWPLATFYLNETRSHLRWAVRIIPKRQDSAGREVDLQAILQAFENSPWKQMEQAIAAKDKPLFEQKYRFALETCYGCHKAAEKGYLRPQIPTAPESPIINFEQSAEWPK